MKYRYIRNTTLSGLLLAIGICASLVSCDKEVQPRVIITDLDTTLYPGNFIDYVFPTFGENENTLRNVIIEDFTGHKCKSCPYATNVAKSLENSNPGRVFSIAIHAGHDGKTNLQDTSPEFPYDFTTPEGLELAIEISNLPDVILTNPFGMLNRTKGSEQNILFKSVEWGEMTSSLLASELDLNLQAKSAYFPSTHGGYLHVESEFLTDIDEKLNILVYIVKDKIIAPQAYDSDYMPNYEHHNVHIGNIYNETWGRQLAHESVSNGTKITTDFSYELPSGVSAEEIHFLVFAYNRDTYEVKQVIKHTL